MSALAPTLQAFFTDRLVQQRHASPHTIAAYRDAWRLLVRFAADHLAKAPSQLEIDDIDAPLVGRFLTHLEHDRANTVRTRNARLSAIHALFRYAALDHPEQAAVIARVLAIPRKRSPYQLVTFLSDSEVDALLAAPDRTTWTGRRDHTLLALAVQTGLRASELTSLRCVDLHLSRGAYVNCLGKGRKQRITPLTRPVIAALRTWLAERNDIRDAPVFPTRTGQPLSRDALAQRLAKHVAHRRPRLSCSPREDRHPAHAATHRGHAVAARRGRHHRHRPVARTRTRRHDQHLHPCRPRPEGTCAREDHPHQRPRRPLSAHRLALGLPRRAVIMPTDSAQTPLAAGESAPISA